MHDKKNEGLFKGREGATKGRMTKMKDMRQSSRIGTSRIREYGRDEIRDMSYIS